jgi:hypothetical protein
MRPRRAAAQVTSTGAVGSLYGTLSGLGARTLEDPRDLSRVATDLERDPVIRRQAAGEQLENVDALDLRRRAEDHFRSADLALSDLPLQRGSGVSDFVGALERSHALRVAGNRRRYVDSRSSSCDGGCRVPAALAHDRLGLRS